MKAGFYPKLAVDGIRKNHRLYVPYLVTCALMCMMSYILLFLARAPAISQLPGGDAIQQMMQLGTYIMTLFGVLFLFYTNSFLMRRRQREFGLYNILGMGKWSIARILLWETVLVAVVSLTGGMLLGIGLSKVFELGLTNMMGGAVNYGFTVIPGCISGTCLYYCGIYILLLLNNLRKIAVSNPVALLRSESTGEKPPRGSIFWTLAGALLLGGAYYLAVTIADPITAMLIFFLAVGMVILATYLLFISGSVKLCRLLQRKKSYYYKASHFVSVSSMAFRMNRNGAGLASICILLTMVLVMLSTTTAVFIGSEDSLRNRYPRDILMTARFYAPEDMTQQRLDDCREAWQAFLEERAVEPEHVLDYREASMSGLLAGSTLSADPRSFAFSLSGGTEGQVISVFLISLEDYNRMTGAGQTLEDGEILLYPYRMPYREPELSFEGGSTYRVKEVLKTPWENGTASMMISPSLFLVVPELSKAAEPFRGLTYESGNPLMNYYWCYGFDTSLPGQEELELFREMMDHSEEVLDTTADIKSVQWESLEQNRGDFYGLYGGLFFLGVVLSLVFLAATVLIMYYKQISEGYEDQGRFEIMKKVGMTDGNIRRAVHSQMLTVFFLPLGAAGVHMCFAYPMVEKILLLMGLQNTALFLETTAVCFGVFGFFYALVYAATSNVYYKIVNG